MLESSDVYRETYEVVKKIGEGGFGKVFSVKNKENNEIFAAKCIRARLRAKEGRNIKIIDFGTAIRLVPGKKARRDL